MTLAIDSVGSNFIGFNGLTTFTDSITTTVPNCIILASPANNQASGGLQTNTVSGGGLTWTRRGRVQFTGGGFSNTMDLWWAIAPAAGTYSITNTVSAMAASSFNVMRLFAVSGGDTVTPFDSHNASSVSATGASSTQPTANLTTDNVNDMLLGLLASPGGGGSTTPQTGFTVVGTATTSVIIDQKVVSATQSATAISGTGTDTQPWGMLADALRSPIDGNASNTATTAASVSASLTTASANDVIIAYVSVVGTGATNVTSTVTGGGLSWTLRKRSQRQNDVWRLLEEWYAIAASPLSAASITATFSGGTAAAAKISLFGISGANTSSPFDADASLPAEGFWDNTGNDANTKLLLHMEGANNSTTFTDSSASANTITSTATISTTTPKFDSGCALFNGTSQKMQPNNHATFEPGSGDFTIDLWMRTASITGSRMVVCKHNGSGPPSNGPYALFMNGNQLELYMSSNGTTWDVVSASVIKAGITVDNLYHHVAVVRNGTNVFTFWDGALVSTISIGSVTLVANATVNFTIGATADGQTFFSGRIDEVRYSNIARWTSTFTPPVAAYGVTSAASVSINTSNPNDIIIWHVLEENATPTLESGFSSIQSIGTTDLEEYKVVSTTQTGLAAGSGNSTDMWTVIADAVKQSSPTTFLTGAVGSYSISGAAAKFAIVEPWAAGAYTINGAAAGGNFPFPVTPGAYVLMGQPAALLATPRLGLGQPGVYLITGYAVAPEVSMPLAAGHYDLTGAPAALLHSYTFGPNAGVYIITGFNANLRQSFDFPIDAGIYSITGFDSSPRFEGEVILSGGSGVYTMDGFPVDMFRFKAPEVTEIRGGGGIPPKDWPVARVELDLFRGAAYRKGMDALVPPQMVAEANLNVARHIPQRPVMNRTPLRK